MRAGERRLWREAAGVRPWLFGGVACGGAAGLALVPQAWLMAGMVNSAWLGQARLSELAQPAILVAALFALRGLLAAAADTAGRAAARRVRSRLRLRVLGAVLAARPGALASERAGELATTLTRGVDALDGYFAAYLPQLGAAVAVPLVVIAWIAPHDLLSALILAVTVPLVPLFMALVGMATRERSERRWQELARLGGYFLDLVRGLATLRAFGRGPDKLADVRAVSESYRRATMHALQGAFLSSLVLELAAAVSTALVAVAVGLRLDQGSLDLRTGLAVLILAPEVYLPLRRLGAQYHATLDALVPAERLWALEGELAERRSGSSTADLGATALEMRDVWFARPDRGPVLAGADVVIEPGTHVALVGQSGAGKTTLLALLLGHEVPDAGRLLVGGIDLRDLDTQAHRRQVAWLPQRPALLEGTVAENLRLARADASSEEVRTAAAALGLDDVLALRVGSGGQDLSAGQRQRVGLARLLLRDAPMVLLDEPTAHLDHAAERRLLAQLRRWRNRTVVIATHSHVVASACDRVIELADGRLRELTAVRTA